MLASRATAGAARNAPRSISRWAIWDRISCLPIHGEISRDGSSVRFVRILVRNELAGFGGSSDGVRCSFFPAFFPDVEQNFRRSSFRFFQLPVPSEHSSGHVAPDHRRQPRKFPPERDAQVRADTHDCSPHLCRCRERAGLDQDPALDPIP